MTEAAGEVKILLTLDGVSYSTAMKKAQEQVKQFQTATVGAAGVTRAQMTEARGTVMVLGEEIGVHLPRHVQRFIASLPGIAPVMSAAFSSVAVIAIGVAIFDAAKKVVDFAQKNQDAARKNAEAWREISSSMRVTNDDLQVANDKLEMAIAKLEGKPENGLKAAIDEAIQSADTLGEKLQGDAQKIAQTLEAQQPGLLARFFGTATDTSDVTGRSRNLQTQFDAIQIEADAHLADLRKQGATQAEIDQVTADIATARKTAIDKELADWGRPQLAAAQAERTRERGTGGPAGTHGGPDIRARLAILMNYVASLGRESDFIDLSQTHGVLEGQESQARAAHDNAEVAAKAYAAVLEREMKAVPERIKLLVDTPTKEREQRQRVFKSTLEPAAAPVDLGRDIAGEMQADIGRYGPQWREYNDLVAKGREGQIKMAAALDIVRTHLQETTGAISPHIAALANAAAHAAEYGAELATLQGQLQQIAGDQALTPAERETQAQKVRNQIGELNGQNQVQAAQDQAQIRATSALGQFTDKLREAAQQWTNIGAVASDFILHSTESFNETLMKVLSSPANMMRGKHPWGQLGASVAESAGSSALKFGEGEVMKLLFGKNSNAKLGTQGNPMWVKSVGDTSANGLLAKLFTGGSTGGSAAGNTTQSFTSVALGAVMGAAGIPHFADGGTLPTNMPALVGENGPELLPPSYAGGRRILPNNKAFGGPPIVNVDARGSTDPAAINAGVHRAMQSYLPHLPKMALAAQADRNRRMPAGRRS